MVTVTCFDKTLRTPKLENEVFEFDFEENMYFSAANKVNQNKINIINITSNMIPLLLIGFQYKFFQNRKSIKINENTNLNLISNFKLNKKKVPRRTGLRKNNNQSNQLNGIKQKKLPRLIPIRPPIHLQQLRRPRITQQLDRLMQLRKRIYRRRKRLLTLINQRHA